MASTIYILRISLHYSKPPIWRQVAVPGNITLGQLHEVIQIAMGWTDSHLHQFTLKDKSLINHDPKRIARLTEEGRYGDIFTITRGIRAFVPAKTPFGDPTELDGEDEDDVTLTEVYPNVKSKLIYGYDFGDSWEHTIEVQKIQEPKPDVEYPVCLAGKLACPPEDCGGIPGYYHLLEVIADPKHEDHADMIEWMEDDFDPEVFDLGEVNNKLAKLRKS